MNAELSLFSFLNIWDEGEGFGYSYFIQTYHDCFSLRPRLLNNRIIIGEWRTSGRKIHFHRYFITTGTIPRLRPLNISLKVSTNMTEVKERGNSENF